MDRTVKAFDFMPPSLYEQIHQDMLNKIAAKEWVPGQRIPTEMELCEIYNVSRITIRRAMDDLVQSGHLKRLRGKGTFVAPEIIENKLVKFYSFSETLKYKGLTEEAEVLTFDLITADRFLANKLKIASPDLPVFKINRLRSVDEVPYAVETSYIPEKIVSGLTEDMVAENGLYNAMRSLGVAPDRAAETFRAVSMVGLEARLLRQDVKAPVMAIERLTFSGAVCVEYCRSIVRGDFFSYTVELG